MVSKKIAQSLGGASFIRAMFEEGEKLRKIHGADNVYDFSLGNPEIEPPEEIRSTILKLLTDEVPGKHRYMSNSGYADTRAKIADYLTQEQGVPVSADNIVMTVGAAGALNVALKTLLNPGEEVIVFSPFFVEYLTYIDNHGGVPVIVKTDPATFQPDPEVLRQSITPRTKAMIINSPNNPTGVVYKEEILKKVSAVLEEKEKEYGTSICVLSDEPYVKIVYDGIKVPSIFKIFKNSIIINSFSKSLALPGERIGYAAANSTTEEIQLLMGGLIYANRVLGFVNAPALFQKVVAENLDITVDPEFYKIRRDILYNHLTSLGFKCLKPEGAFYLFPESLIEDDKEFCRIAMKYNLLLVPGSGFGWPGYFRMAYCISLKTIENSLPAFEKLAAEFRK